MFKVIFFFLDAVDRRQPAVDDDQGVVGGDNRIRIGFRNADPDATEHRSTDHHGETRWARKASSNISQKNRYI